MSELEQGTVLRLLKSDWPIDTSVSEMYGEIVIKIPQKWVDEAIELIETLQFRIESLEK